MPRRAVPSRLGRKQSNAGRAGLSRLGLKQSKKKKKENILHTVDKRGCGAKLGFLGKPGVKDAGVRILLQTQGSKTRRRGRWVKVRNARNASHIRGSRGWALRKSKRFVRWPNWSRL